MKGEREEWKRTVSEAGQIRKKDPRSAGVSQAGKTKRDKSKLWGVPVSSLGPNKMNYTYGN